MLWKMFVYIDWKMENQVNAFLIIPFFFFKCWSAYYINSAITCAICLFVCLFLSLCRICALRSSDHFYNILPPAPLHLSRCMWARFCSDEILIKNIMHVNKWKQLNSSAVLNFHCGKKRSRFLYHPLIRFFALAISPYRPMYTHTFS